jgi:hypothetical protein
MGVGRWELGDERGALGFKPPHRSFPSSLRTKRQDAASTSGPRRLRRSWQLAVGSWQAAGRRKSRVATASCRGVGNRAKRVVTRGVFTRSPRRSRRLDRRWRSRVEAASCRFVGNRSKRLMTRSALRARELGDGSREASGRRHEAGGKLSNLPTFLPPHLPTFLPPHLPTSPPKRGATPRPLSLGVLTGR